MNARNVLTRAVKPMVIIGGLLILYAVAGFYLLPVVMQSKLPDMIEQATKRKAAIKKIAFDPFSLRLNLEGFEILESDGRPFAAFNRFYVDLDVFRSIGHRALAIDKLLLDRPMVRVARLKNGQFNFSDLLTATAEPDEQERAVFPIVIGQLSIAGGNLIWEDARFDTPITEEIHAIQFKVEKLSTVASEQFPLHFSCALKSGGQFDWQGDANVQPLSSSGRIKLDQINLHRLQELAVQDALNFDLQGSELLELDYAVNQSDKGLELDIKKSRIVLSDFAYSEQKVEGIQFKSASIVNEAAYKVSLAGDQWRLTADNNKLELKDIFLAGPGNGKAFLEIPNVAMAAHYQADNADSRINFKLGAEQFAVRDLKLSESGHSEPLVSIAAFTVSDIGFDLNKQELAVESVKSEQGKFKVWLDSDGQVNYSKFLPKDQPTGKTSETAQAAAASTPESAPWKISLDHIEINKYGLAFEDRTLKHPLTIDVTPINIALSGYSNKEGASLPFQFSAGVNKSGLIKLNGDLIVNPFSARLDVAAQDIELERFQPYVDKYARLDIIDGKWNADGKMAIALPAREGLDLKFKGSTGIAGLLTRDQILHKDFVKWKKLTLQDIDADVSANRYTARLLQINNPYARVIIAKDKTINVNDVLMTGKGEKAQSNKAKKPQKESKGPYFRLDKIQIVNGSSDFADLSLILPFAAPIKSLNGGAAGISSERKSSVKVSLKGNAYDLAPVAINGDVSPYLGEYNVEMNFFGMPMPLVSPYMVQFAGYKVEKGKLTLGLKYQVAKGQLTASNNILIDQFELGEKVENPNAVSLPLELAVALLKDSSGNIKLDVPITGSLEDPKFSLGGIIADALLNTITKIVTSPFNAIASLIGGEENLDSVSFAAGKSELDKQQVQKLYGIAGALKERPILTIEIKGAAFQDLDWPALRESALYDQLKKMKADEINKKDGKKTLAEYVELSDDDYKRLLAQLFLEKFPLLADKSLFGAPRLKDPSGGDFYAVAKQKLAEIIKPDPHRLEELAAKRAQTIAKYIVQQGGIANERVYILDPVIDPAQENKEITSFLSLKTK